MKLARYVGDGNIEIRDEPRPLCPPGGLLVRTLASGLCSGELMDWYMDQKIPHVLGHEVCAEVIESEDARFPVGSRIFPHHHAPCLTCDRCRRGLFVHCKQWKRTKLVPGGMAEYFAVGAENLTDTHRVDDLRPVDAALIEPLACVAKGLALAEPGCRSCAVVGLGAMGLMHLLALPEGAVGYELNPSRRAYASTLGLDARDPAQSEGAEVVFVCPGSAQAIDLAIEIANPGGTILLFAPLPPTGAHPVNLHAAYFKDLRLFNSYSCGPSDTAAAMALIRSGRLKAEQVVSNFTNLEGLPSLYRSMKSGDILKVMVVLEE